MSAIQLDLTCLEMSFWIHPAFFHAGAFVEFVEEDEFSFLGLHVVVDPDLVLGYKVVDLIMTTACEVDKKEITDGLTVYNPDRETGCLVQVPFLFVNMRVKMWAMFAFFFTDGLHELGFRSFFLLQSTTRSDRISITHSLSHHGVFKQ